jgi:hypothetical protein
MSKMTKRKLTTEEIDDLCSIIELNRFIPEETATCVRNGLVKSIRGQLEAVTIYPTMIPKLKKIIEKEYYTTQLQAGEMVGVQAATSIGEPVSQMTLNAFHFSGISSIGIASGVPRVEELLNASKKQKSYGMTLYMDRKYDIHVLKRKIMSSIMEVYLSNITEHYTIEYVSSLDSLNETDRKWYPLYFAMYSSEILEEGELKYHWRIRFKLNKSKMYDHSVSCLTVGKKIEDAFRDLYVVASPDNIGIVDVYVDFSQMKLKKKEEEDIGILDNKKEGMCLYNIILPYLNDILVSGVEGIESMFIREDKNEWVIDTQGSNLMNIFAYEGFDSKRCSSSDIWEIYNMLGVEATRQFIINEFYKVLAISGASVGRRHIELLADSMTFQGKINSVNRYGIDRNETGPLAKASFEESVNNFFIASVNNETDDMGVSSSIMAGKLAEMGTGYMDLIYDIHAKMPNVSVPDPIAEREKLKELKKLEAKNVQPVKPVNSTPIPQYSVPLQNSNATPEYALTYNLSFMTQNVGSVVEHTNPLPYTVPQTVIPKPISVHKPIEKQLLKPLTKIKTTKPAILEKRKTPPVSTPISTDQVQTVSWVKKPKKVVIKFSEDE